MKLNINKCKVMHFGIHNKKQTYRLTESGFLNETTVEKDLGVYINNELKWDKLVTEITKNALAIIFNFS